MKKLIVIVFFVISATAFSQNTMHYWEKVKENFTDQQILELLALIGFCLGMGRLLAVLDIANDCPVNRTADPDKDPTHYVHG